MTHREQREAARRSQAAAGDPRALLLATTPSAERSEVAARYDHQREADTLDQYAEPTGEDLRTIQLELWRAQVAVTLAETAGYRDIAARYLGGHLTSAGMERAIVEAELATPMLSEAEALVAWQQARRLRRQYLRSRYGV